MIKYSFFAVTHTIAISFDVSKLLGSILNNTWFNSEILF